MKFELLAAALQRHLGRLVTATITAPLFVAKDRVLRNFCSDHRVTLRCGRRGTIFTFSFPSVGLPVANSASGEWRDASVRRLVGAAAEALDFGHRRLERLRLDRDLEGAEEMMDLLAGLAARMRIEDA